MKTSFLITLSVITGIFMGVLIALTIAVNNPIVKLECPYEYGECPHRLCPNNINLGYQYVLSDSGTEVFQGTRFVGFLPFDSTQQLDKLMIGDNQ